MKFFASNHWLRFIFKLTTLWHKWQVSELVLTDFEHSILYDYWQKGFNFKFQNFFFSTYVHLCLKITISTKPLLPANNWMDIPNPTRKKKKKRGVERTYFFEKPLKNFCFLLYCWKFSKNQGSTSGNSASKIVLPSALVSQKMF